MAKLNVPKTRLYTHEGAVAYHLTPELELRRSVMACMLWEGTFYEEGVEIAARIVDLIPKVKADKVAEMAIEAREKMKLRHVPLLLANELEKRTITALEDARKRRYPVAGLLERIIQRPDELTEFMAIYWKEGKHPLSHQVMKGLAGAFRKFSEYSLAKYDRDDVIKLRDVLFLCHAKPRDKEQEELWKRLIDRKMAVPDTWEVALSAGKDKKETWERLLSEDKLGGLALLRNLRNMKEAGVNRQLVFDALERMKVERILPFRFISAAKYAPQWEPQIEKAMMKCLGEQEKLPGKTALVVDGSGSMFGAPVSAKSEINRFEAAAALAILIREVCAEATVTVFSNSAFLIPARHGFALRDAISKKAEQGGTMTQNGIMKAAREGYDRIIVITDEQSHQSVSNPLVGTRGYFINVGSYKNGIGYGPWLHIDGWSEAILDYIRVFEQGVNHDNQR
jgi:hypothetical protein